LLSASVGYWISEHVAGRGIIPTAVALVCDWCFTDLGLHRVEINIRPENAASLRVVAKLGFREEGVRKSFLHIQGRWADHRSFALTAEEVGPGVLQRWLATNPGPCARGRRNRAASIHSPVVTPGRTPAGYRLHGPSNEPLCVLPARHAGPAQPFRAVGPLRSELWSSLDGSYWRSGSCASATCCLQRSGRGRSWSIPASTTDSRETCEC